MLLVLMLMLALLAQSSLTLCVQVLHGYVSLFTVVMVLLVLLLFML